MLDFTYPEKGLMWLINVTDLFILINASRQMIHGTEKRFAYFTEDDSDVELFCNFWRSHTTTKGGEDEEKGKKEKSGLPLKSEKKV